ncbi:MAG TPA: nicotinate-nicotinamide nucleotide adenylyltransferase [bacterium]|nr:nicotinate-nicotinamide nucleotide adenylyltransferase [bacterium]
MRKTSSADRVALFGGKFDPPHLGHQLTLFLCLEKFGMDEVWVIPSAAHAFGYTMSPFELRLTMCRLLAAPWKGRRRVKVLADEQALPQRPVYTIDLVRHLREEYGPRDYHLIIGEDNWKARADWKEFDELSQLAKPLVIGRGGGSNLQLALPDISSTAIRTAVAQNAPWEHLVPAAIPEFVKDKGLYWPKN